MMGMSGWASGGVGEWNADRRERWGRVVRNSSAVRISSLRVNKVSSFQARLLADLYWGTMESSSSSLEEKKLDDGWFFGTLGGDSGCEGSHQLELFEVEMVAVHKGTTLIGKLCRSFAMHSPG